MKFKRKQQIINEYGSQCVVDCLQPYVSELRKARIEKVLAGRLTSIQLALESPADVNNALAAVRTCESFGIACIHLICPEGDAVYSYGITRGAIYWVEVMVHESLQHFLKWIREHDMLLAAGALQAEYELSAVPIEKPLCVLFGNEQRGLSDEAIAAADLTFNIPMYGMTESLNLSVSAAVSLYDLSSRRRAKLAQQGDLTAEQQLDLTANYYLNSMAPRLSLGLLKRLSKF